MLEILAVYLFIQILGYSLYPVLAALMPDSQDRGIAASKIAGVLLITALFWVTENYTLSSFLIICSGMVIGTLVFYLNDRSLLKNPHIKTVELLFLFSFIAFLTLRSFTPEIHWGEKPMDSTFLNYFIRTDTLPPIDPWASGNQLQYYYFGYLFWSAVLKIPFLDSGYGYNVAFAATAALYLTTLYSLLLWVVRTKAGAVLGAIFIGTISNFEMLYLVLFKDKPLNFDTWWASSRSLASPAFNEYPVWSIIFGDLHAHVIALPLVVFLVHLGIYLSKYKSLFIPIILGAALGFHFGFNAWDLFVIGFLGLVLGLTSKKPLGTRIVDLILLSITFFYVQHLVSSEITPATSELHWGWVYGNEFNSFWNIFSHFGLFLTLCGSILCLFILSSYQGYDWLKTFAFFILFLLPLFISKSPEKAWSVSLCLGFFAAVSANALTHKRLKEPLIFKLMLASLLFLTYIEHIFILDRMNTLFKTYHGVWLVLGLASVGALSLFAELKRGFLAIPLICVLWGFLGTILSVYIMTSFQRVPGPRPTLNGRAYLVYYDGDESRLISWINENIYGTPKIVEAQGHSYAEFSRITMHTGLPVILGWDHHVSQRGTERREVEKRKDDIRTIYTSPSIDEVSAILKKYEVRYVVWGNLEKRTYGENSIFFNHPERFKPIFNSGSVYLFEVMWE